MSAPKEDSLLLAIKRARAHAAQADVVRAKVTGLQSTSHHFPPTTYWKMFHQLWEIVSNLLNYFIHEKRRPSITNVCGLPYFGYFLLCWIARMEIHPLVPFLPSLHDGVSDVTGETPPPLLRWQPMTSGSDVKSPSLHHWCSKAALR